MSAAVAGIMRTLCERYLTKGPRALYHLTLRADEGGCFEVVFRWNNPKGADSKVIRVPDEAAGHALFDSKLEEMLERGYEPRRTARGQDEPAPSPPAVHGAEVVAALAAIESMGREPATLEELLEQRRREAPWPLV